MFPLLENHRFVVSGDSCLIRIIEYPIGWAHSLLLCKSHRFERVRREHSLCRAPALFGKSRLMNLHSLGPLIVGS